MKEFDILAGITCAHASTAPGNDCTRLLRPLRHGEKLPDHCCPSVAQAACKMWMLSKVGTDWTFGSEAPVRLSLTDCDTLNAHDLDDWPYSLEENTARLHVVIRQWVEDEPESLLDMLQHNRDVVSYIDALARSMRPAEYVNEFRERGDCESLRRWLRANGLPNSSSMQEWLLYRAHLLPHSQGPRIGVCVTTFCIVRPQAPAGYLGTFPDSSNGRANLLAETVTSISGLSSWFSADGLRQAGRTAHLHAEWWRNSAGRPAYDPDERKRPRPESRYADSVKHKVVRLKELGNNDRQIEDRIVTEHASTAADAKKIRENVRRCLRALRK